MDVVHWDLNWLHWATRSPLGLTVNMGAGAEEVAVEPGRDVATAAWDVAGEGAAAGVVTTAGTGAGAGTGATTGAKVGGGDAGGLGTVAMKTLGAGVAGGTKTTCVTNTGCCCQTTHCPATLQLSHANTTHASHSIKIRRNVHTAMSRQTRRICAETRKKEAQWVKLKCHGIVASAGHCVWPHQFR